MIDTNMSGKWKAGKLEAIADFSNGKLSPTREPSYNVPVYGSNGLIGYADAFNSDEGTSIIGRVGSYCGSVYYSNEKCWVTDNAIKGKPKANNSSKYLYYLLTFLKLNNHRAGSGQPLINQSILNTIDIVYPDFKTQEYIAKILSVLDEKIELNNKMNRTLEQIAQAIFKHWFIDFEFPVKLSSLKVEVKDGGKLDLSSIESILKSPGYRSAGGKMVDSEMGKIPAGWEICSIENILDLNRSTTIPTERNKYNLYSIEAYDNGQVPIITDGQEIKSNKFIVNSNTILFCKLNPRIPRVWLVLKTEDLSISSTEFLNLNVKEECFLQFVFSFLSSAAFFDLIKGAVSGTSSSHQRINIDHLMKYRIIKPNTEIVKYYSNITNSLFELINFNKEENQTLSQLRDSLLPRLMSGKIKVSANV